MRSFPSPSLSFDSPHPSSFNPAGQAPLTAPTASILSPELDLDRRGNPLDSPGLVAGGERCCSPFSDGASDCSTSTSPSLYSPGLECDEPAFAFGHPASAQAHATASAILARRRRSFARRTARQFAALHPTAHALVLNFAAATSAAVQTTGSQMYAERAAFDPRQEDEARERPTVFDSVAFSPGPGQADEQFDVYLCQSARFSLGEVDNDERVWGFSSPQWEKVGPYVFFEHIPLVPSV